MAITIKKVETRKDLDAFIKFTNRLYKGNAFFVPNLHLDMLNTLDKRKNPAFEFCEADYFLAYKDGKVAGRIAAIINKRANTVWGKKETRFGWIDFIDDVEVSRALLETAAQWGKERGMEYLQGPLGFTDFDPEGMLVEGYDQLSTMSTIYNYPYYPRHMEQLGFEKDVDWVEYKIYVPDSIPEKYKRIAELVQKKYNLKIKKYTSSKALARDYGQKIFQLMNEAYTPLYGFAPLSEGQIELYIKMYLPVIDLRMVTLILDSDDNLVGVGISMPSLSRFFPFGWYHVLKALFIRHAPVLDLLLVAIKPEYQNKGVNALLFSDLIPVYQQMGFKYAESNPELEQNGKVQAQWEYFDTELHRRRRAYIKAI